MKVDKYTSTIVAIAAAMALLLVKTVGPDGKAIPAWAVITQVWSGEPAAALALLAWGLGG